MKKAIKYNLVYKKFKNNIKINEILLNLLKK
jgi:hypothetical protein